MDRHENIDRRDCLRQEAEKMVKNKQFYEDSEHSESDMLKLIQELKVYQVELEMQNEELVIAKENAELARKKYTELYDFSPSGYISLLKDGKITQLNFMTAQLLGEERYMIKNTKFQDFVYKQDKFMFNNFLQSVFLSEVKQCCEIQLETGKNPPIYISIEGVVALDGEQCLLTLVNITQSKEIKNELTKAKERAEESDRLKSAFLANMSHEIRTPMNGILGFAELLGDHDLSNEKQQYYISIIEGSGKRMLNIINDIIDISKIESGLMNVNTSSVNVNEQTGYIYTFLKPEVEKRGIKLYIKNGLADGLSFIDSDSEKIYAILLNLVKNAIKFTKTGFVEFGYEKKANWLEFYVKDTGIGIPINKQKSIFERFIQADSSNIKAFDGTGLGLSISKSYTEMLGGTMWLVSEESVGSTFYFTIPYTIDRS
jgi:signal transduction histidine kinase